jgi:ABC-type transport system involved in multi-copper enzyme maturation permease subunit
MNKWWVVARREWQVSFQSPLAYVLLGIWMLLAGYFYF